MVRAAVKNADVVICGAGMAGVATAYFLSKKMGVQDVLLVDKRAPLSLTSDKSAELYSRAWINETMFRFMNRSVDIMEDLARETGNVFNMNRRGGCSVALTDQGASDFKSMLREQAHLGLGPSRVCKQSGVASTPYVPSAIEGFGGGPQGADLLLDKSLIREYYPYLSDKVTAILHTRGSGWFSAHTLGMYLLEQAKAHGTRELCGEVIAVEKDKQGVCGIEVAMEGSVETIKTRRFVNAAGPFVKRVAAMVDTDIPVRATLIAKIVIEDYLGVVPRSAPSLSLSDEFFMEWSEEDKELLREDDEFRWLLDKFSSGPYMHIEGGKGSKWFMVAWGYNQRLGAAVTDEPQWDPQFPKEYPELVLRGASILIPGLKRYAEKMPRFMYDGGYFMTTPDPAGKVDAEGTTSQSLPLVGPLGVDGAFVVNSPFGVRAGCACGELCAAWVTGGKLPDYADELSLKRYA